MREANYKTIKGAKRYFLGLAKDFHMTDSVVDKLMAANTVCEIEHIWKDAVSNL